MSLRELAQLMEARGIKRIARFNCAASNFEGF